MKRKPLEGAKIDKLIGDKMREVRTVCGLTVEDIGRFFNISYQQVTKYEKGLSRISAVNLHKFARKTDTNILIYFDGTTLDAVNLKMLQMTMRNINKMCPEMQESFYNLTKSMLNELEI